MVGGSDKQANEENIAYLRNLYNRNVETEPRELIVRGGKPMIVSMDGAILL